VDAFTTKRLVTVGLEAVAMLAILFILAVFGLHGGLVGAFVGFMVRGARDKYTTPIADELIAKL
jgi:hypothetical protein